MKFTFSKTSRERLNTCHPDLIKVFNLAINLTNVDFGISCGHRSTAQQKKLFAQGRTKPGDIVTNVDGVNNKSKHNYLPALAVDVYPYVNGRANWSRSHCVYIAGVIQAAAKLLYNQGQINSRIRWGGNWDQDGEIITDQQFNDLPHFEIR